MKTANKENLASSKVRCGCRRIPATDNIWFIQQIPPKIMLTVWLFCKNNHVSSQQFNLKIIIENRETADIRVD
jgi:hypothetical protein